MKCMNEKGLEAYQVKRNLKKFEESLRNKFGVKMRVFGRWIVADRSREIEEMREESWLEEYIDPSVMLDSWGIGRYWGSCRGRCRGTSRRQLRYREGIEQPRIRFKNRSSINPLGVEELSRRQELSRSIHQVSRRFRDCV